MLGSTLALNCCTCCCALASLAEARKVTRVPTLMPEASVAASRRRRRPAMAAAWSVAST